MSVLVFSVYAFVVNSLTNFISLHINARNHFHRFPLPLSLEVAFLRRDIWVVLMVLSLPTMQSELAFISNLENNDDNNNC